MSDQGGEMGWLLTPPAPGEVRILVAMGERACPTPELRHAVEQLATVLQEQEIGGDSGGHYFIPFPRTEDKLGKTGLGEHAINFGFRAIQHCRSVRDATS